MNGLDATLQAACPCVMHPRYEPLQLLTEDTHRFLICGDGLYVEVRRQWLHAMLKVSDVGIPLPYGSPEPFLRVNVETPALIRGLQHFIARAQAVSPLEHAAWLSFDPVSRAIGYIEPQVISRSGAHIQYHRPEVSSHCLPAVDCHSHGIFDAFFSGTDEIDDMDDAKLAFVVGNLDKPQPSVVMRFVGFGFTHDISDWARSLIYAEYLGVSTDSGEQQ